MKKKEEKEKKISAGHQYWRGVRWWKLQKIRRAKLIVIWISEVAEGAGRIRTEGERRLGTSWARVSNEVVARSFRNGKKAQRNLGKARIIGSWES